MRKNKYIYTLSALMMACIISFSGVGGSYIQAKATSGAFDALWNTEATAIENIGRHMLLWAHAAGVFLSPSLTSGGMFLLNASDFYDFMISDGYSEEEANEVCHGGGGHVRDGISVDDDGNVTYSDDVCDLFHGYIQNELNQLLGYYIVPTMPLSQWDNPLMFETSAEYQAAQSLMKSLITDTNILFRTASGSYYNNDLYYVHGRLVEDSAFYYLMSPGHSTTTYSDDYGKRFYGGTNFSSQFESDPDYVKYDGYFTMGIYLYNSNWELAYKTYSRFTSDGNSISAVSNYTGTNSSSGDDYSTLMGYASNRDDASLMFFQSPVTSDGRTIKIFKTVDGIKTYDTGNQQVYYTQNWVNYDASQDNSVTMTNNQYQYYTDNSSTLYETIQNNIDNSTEEITEQNVQIIVNNTYNQFMEDSGNDSSGNGSGDSSGGTGIADLFDGIGKIFDTILSLIGKLMGVVADFTQSILDLFSGFTTFTDGFSQFLAGAFGFIPAEIWNVIQVGLSLMVLAAIIKFLRK